MRIANKTLYDSTIRMLGKVSSEMTDAYITASTGKRINSLSDDPVGLVTVLNLRASIANIGQMQKNIDMGRSWLIACESALTQTEEILAAAKEMCVQYSSANISAEQRSNAVSIVDGYLKQIISLSNSKVGQRYIFSGTNTDAMPFELNPDETMVAYNGNCNPFSVKIGTSSNIEVGRDGQEIFGEDWDNNNIFRTLIDLKAYLKNNDVSGIQSKMNNIDTQLNTVSGVISDIAGKTIRLDIKENIIKDLEVTYSDRKSQIEEIDITEAMIDLNSKEMAYQAALSSSSKVISLSLVDYL
ncbi:MAG: flagellar hook-associated protein FlgL [Deltaproteobacteria bacterium]|nr:flagellar hook-associated protein FlgL [Deltaproteobacteria bacterium]